MYRIIKSEKYIFDLLGEMPNIEMPTMGGHVFWNTVKEDCGYKLQQNVITGHARIIDGADYRVAWGSYSAMIKKFRELTCNDELVAGDIIGVERLGYAHYAVYIGNDRVIHYASETGDFGDNITIHEAPMSEFLRGSDSFFVLDFPDEYGKPTKVYSSAAFLGSAFSIFAKAIKGITYHLYSPEETVERAESRIGETSYDLITNNCEHFAIWCKTGISESHQVNNILNLIDPLNVIVD